MKPRLSVRGNPAERVTRQTVLTLKNNLIRENEVGGDRYVIEGEGTKDFTTFYSGLKPPTPAADAPEVLGAKRWRPAMVEIGLHAGSVRYGGETFASTLFVFSPPPGGGSFPLSSGNTLHDGWASACR